MTGMSRYSVGRVVSAALDPVLMPAGFAAGQYGEGGEGGEDRSTGSQVIFCAAHDEISDLHSWLPQANSQKRDVGACVDLVVEINNQSRVEFIHLEGLSLRRPCGTSAGLLTRTRWREWTDRPSTTPYRSLPQY